MHHLKTGEWGELMSTPAPVTNLSQLYGSRAAGSFPGHKQWHLEEFHRVAELSQMI